MWELWLASPTSTIRWSAKRSNNLAKAGPCKLGKASARPAISSGRS
jgi:hypothetical protein